MLFYRKIPLKNGVECILRNAERTDADAFLGYFMRCHGETDYLTTYPDETEHDLNKVSARLGAKAESASEIELLAVLDGRIVGNAGISVVKDRDKTRHRADFGVSILKDFWGLGIGSALTAACIDCARKAGFLQLELDVVAENESAVKLYMKHGFVEYGRNPKGFKSRTGRWQELVLMRLELQ